MTNLSDRVESAVTKIEDSSDIAEKFSDASATVEFNTPKGPVKPIGQLQQEADAAIARIAHFTEETWVAGQEYTEKKIYFIHNGIAYNPVVIPYTAGLVDIQADIDAGLFTVLQGLTHSDVGKTNEKLIKGGYSVITCPVLIGGVEDQVLDIGQTVYTKGFYFSGDGGGAFYTVTNDVPNGFSVIGLNDGKSLTVIEDGSFNALRYGAKLNGVDDDHNAIAFMVNNLNKCDLQNRTAKMGSFVVFNPGNRYEVVNGVLDFSDVAMDGELITVEGHGFSQPLSITTNVNYPMDSFQVDLITDIDTDDIISINSSGSWSINTLQSEFAVVDSISENMIKVRGVVCGDYKITDNPKVRKFDMSTGLKIDSLTVIGNYDFNQTALRGRYLSYSGWGDNVVIKNCRKRCFWFQDSVFLSGQGTPIFINSDMEGFGYGISTGGCQWVNAGNMTGINCRHVTTSGDSQSQGMLARWQVYGDIIGIGCRDAICDTHDGCCDFTYNSITGITNYGNGADDAVTMEGARIHIGKINVNRVERFGLYVNFCGMGDTGRSSFITVDSIVLDEKATGDYLAVIKNVSGSLGHKIDTVKIGNITGYGERGIIVNAEDGDIKYVSIDMNITVETDSSVEIISSGGQVKDANLSGVVSHLSSSNVHYPLFLNGGAWSSANADISATDCNLSGLKIYASDEALNAVRNIDCVVNAFGFSAEGLFSNGLFREDGVGVIKRDNAQIIAHKEYYNPLEIAAGSSEVADIAVPNIVFGMFVLVSWSDDPQGIELTGHILSSGVVRVKLKNTSSSPVNLPPGHILVKVTE